MASHPPPPVPSSPPSSGGVRRHHTITAASRPARNAPKEIISEEQPEQPPWNQDEPVDHDWVGGVGAVGDKSSSLHRQSSLPTRYHRGFQNRASKSGNLTPKTINSLAAIAGHEGDDEPWNVAEYSVHEEEPPSPDQNQQPQSTDLAQSATSPLSPHFSNSATPQIPSPPPAGSGAAVRRHVSLTYGADVGGPRRVQGLKRAGTLQAPVPPQNVSPAPDATENVSDLGDDYTYGGDGDEYEYVEEFPDNPSPPQQHQQQQQMQQQQQQIQSQYVRSPWGDFRSSFSGSGAGNGVGGVAIDEVQLALSAIELASNSSNIMSPGRYDVYQTGPGGQSAHPPRFNPSYPPPQNPPGSRNNVGSGNHSNVNGNNGGSGKLHLVTEFDERKAQSGQGTRTAYVQQTQPRYQRDDRASSAGGSWDQMDRELTSRTSNPNLQYGYQQSGQHSKNGSNSGSGVPNVPPIPAQYLGSRGYGSGNGNAGNGNDRNSGGNGNGNAAGNGSGGNSGGTPASGQAATQGFVNTPIDVPSLIATKGYNPANFDTRPQFARYFVIKSYTEDDVHKSLKYEIWSSTDPGNKRLDKAFKETAGRGPIYLFFSVNASGHFCGMAEMLTPVDYTRSSTVWASDKWKGVFKVRWIFVRDIPNVNLRHIKLNNTQERKPVTNSRDTQELLPDAGQEMLRIFHTHPARTSLLQDFAFYELQAMQKMQGQSGSSSPQPPPAATPTFAYPMSPMMQMQMGMGMGMGGAMNMGGMGGNLGTGMGGMGMGAGMGMAGIGIGSALQPNQAMHQSVLRHSSPSPPSQNQGGGQAFIGMTNY